MVFAVFCWEAARDRRKHNNIHMKKGEKRRLKKEDLSKLTGIFRYVIPYKISFIIGLILLVISSSVMMIFPYVAGKLIDIASGKTDWIAADIDTAALYLLGVFVFMAVVSFFRVLLFAKVTENAMANIRKELYTRMVAMPMTFFDKNRAGELISRISNDVSILQDTLSVTLAEIIRQFIILIVGIGVIFYTTPSLSVFMLVTFPIIVILAMIFGKFIRKQSRRTQDKLANANVIVDETIQGIFSVKAYTSESREVNRYSHAMNGVVKTALKVAKYRAAFISFIISMIMGGIVGVIWYGARLVQSGDMLVGELFSFVLYTTFIGASIAGLGDLLSQVSKAVGASERILEIQGETPELDLQEKPAQSAPAGDIVLNGVSFHYPTRPEVKVLDMVDMTIPKGQKVALVGHSGAGKSTIAQLLMRFYEPGSGQITIGGKAVQHMDLGVHRSRLGVVPQEVLLFGGSIAENIGYGKPDATMDEILEAARKANALEFIEKFPEGFDTLVGERGVKLSGGQRQRVAIARAVLKDPEILILDEATSSLDAGSEHLVQQALNSLMQGRTTVIIAHRLATIREVDYIYVLENGRVVESGTHEGLIAEGGAYKGFVDLQMQG